MQMNNELCKHDEILFINKCFLTKRVESFEILKKSNFLEKWEEVSLKKN